MRSRLFPLIVATTFALTALAGCIQGDASSDLDPSAALVVPEDALAVRIPHGTFDPRSQGPWYTLETTAFKGPVTIHWINDDIAPHVIVGMALPAPSGAPAWVSQLVSEGSSGHAHDHDHDHDDDGHTHDGTEGDDHVHANVIFEIFVDAGDSALMELDHVGLIDIHCHPHPWMVDTWHILEGERETYPVVAHSVQLEGRYSGFLEQGNEIAVPWNLHSPNLAAVNAVLSWNDASDDTIGGETTNKPDTMRIALIHPNGSVVAEEEQTARRGEIEIAFDTLLDLPGSISGEGRIDALGRLGAYNGDTDHSGIWQIEVTLVDAPGIGYAEEYLPPETPGRDQKQSWTLTVTMVHQWATVGPATPEVQRLAIYPYDPDAPADDGHVH